MRKVIVIGGGAAGMMAAITAAKENASVILLEKNEKLGKKLFITGKGRCNVTNACDIEDLFRNVCSHDKFLYSAFYSYDNQQVMQFFENAGCKLKIERGNRVFPVSDHSSDVINALKRTMDELGVIIKYHHTVDRLIVSQHDDQMKVDGVVCNGKEKIMADAVIIATGGFSYQLTGSTGDGYRFAKEVGHKVTAISPSLVPLAIKEDVCLQLQGLSLKNVRVRVEQNKKTIYDDFGEMLFTHYGVSGPLILSASSYLVNKAKTPEGTLHIDLKPALSIEQLDKRILREFEENKNKAFKNAITSLFPSKMLPVMPVLAGIDPDKKIHDITKEERMRFVECIKDMKFTITGLRDYNEAIITKGGIHVKEVNPSTMESKLVRSLYFAGEVLDLDALTGGFNLQIAWSTGYLAGLNSSLEED